jgi:protein-ribulosamine 3-kinase
MQLLSKPLLGPLEKVVSEYQGRTWQVSSTQDMSDFACHPCAILSDGSLAVFTKFSDAPDAPRQFEIEQESLQYLSKSTGVLVPAPIAIVPVETGTLFIMEALKPIERAPLQWRQIGKTLARIHRVKSDFCGFHRNNFFGPLEQDNTPLQDWTTFYGERRLKPRLRMAIDSGNLPVSVISQVESVIERLPELCGPAITPVLLHGDAQQNNFISTQKGTYVIDPAIYYGNPELDLAFIDYFQPVPKDVFDGYREEMPIDPGFFERRDLWRISGYLAAVAVEGSAYLGRLRDALQKYL